jgi:hypothetical protein
MSFAAYKPIRNKIAALAMDDALAVIWAHTQFLQINDFNFPKEIEVIDAYLSTSFPSNGSASGSLSFLQGDRVEQRRSRKTTTALFASGKRSARHQLDQEARERHLWRIRLSNQHTCRINPHRAPTVHLAGKLAELRFDIRYYKIFNRPGIDGICEEKIGLNVGRFSCAVWPPWGFLP